jgi:prefoldin beta subunit
VVVRCYLNQELKLQRLKRDKMAENNVPKDVEQKINQLQLFEQNVQSLLMQKQQFQMQSVEIKSALKELEGTEEAFKIIGGIMVSSKKEDLKKELTSKKEMSELRIKALEKQESQIKEKATKLQAEVMEKLKDNK